MIWVGEPSAKAPEQFRTPLQEQVYRALERLEIPFLRVDTEPAVTMEACRAIDLRLNVHTVKTLFLTNRRQTDFYLYVMPGDKPFRTSRFSAALGVSRLSFATPEQLERLMGVEPGAATVFSLLLPSAGETRLVFDRELEGEEWYGCTDGTTTGYMKLAFRDVTERFLPYAGRALEWASCPGEERNAEGKGEAACTGS